MPIQAYLQAHRRAHPSMQAQDIVKLCYQAAFGAEHLLADTERARRYLLAEWEATPPVCGEIYEPICDDIGRVHIGPWRAQGLPFEGLFSLFVAACRPSEDGHARFATYLACADAWLQRTDAACYTQQWQPFMVEYRAAGMPAVHHSDAYRAAEHPAYRIVRRCDLLAYRQGRA